MTESQARRTPVKGYGAGTDCQDSRTHGRRTAQGTSIHKYADGHNSRDATSPSTSADICLA
ncbi:hypothetical protein FM103_07660 [Corynebacterium xerosis]|nr:hypothetical protein FM103_07660 [Corynebacterium xerosis]